MSWRGRPAGAPRCLNSVSCSVPCHLELSVALNFALESGVLPCPRLWLWLWMRGRGERRSWEPPAPGCGLVRGVWFWGGCVWSWEGGRGWELGWGGRGLWGARP